MTNPFETNLKGVKVGNSGRMPGLESRTPLSLEERYNNNLSIFSSIDKEYDELNESIDKLDKAGLLESIEREKKEIEDRVNKKTTGEKIAQWTGIASSLASAAGAFVSMKGAKNVASAGQVQSVDYSKLSDKEIETKISTLTSEISTAKTDLEAKKDLKKQALADKRIYANTIDTKTEEAKTKETERKNQEAEYNKQDKEYKKQEGIENDAKDKLISLNTEKTSASNRKAALEARANSTTNPLSKSEQNELNKLNGGADQKGSIAYIDKKIAEETQRKQKAEQAKNNAEQARTKANDLRQKAEEDRDAAKQLVEETNPKFKQASDNAVIYQNDITQKEQDVRNKETELQNLQTEKTKRAKK